MSALSNQSSPVRAGGEGSDPSEDSIIDPSLIDAESLARAEEDIRCGRTISLDEFERKLRDEGILLRIDERDILGSDVRDWNMWLAALCVFGPIAVGCCIVWLWV